MVNDIFVGREEEQEILLSYLEAAQEGSGQAVFLTGPPGTGKTYLVEKVFQKKKGVRFLQARCNEDDQPYEALVKLLGKYIELDRHQIYGKEAEFYESNVKKCKEAASALSSPETSGTTVQQALFASVEDALFSIAKYNPLVIFIDNLHVADAGSTEFIQFLLNSIDVLPIFLVVAYRDEEVDDYHMLKVITLQEDSNIHNMPLDPLTALDIMEMVEQMMGVTDMPTLFIKRLYKETKGNPIFVREVILSIMGNKEIDRSDPYWYSKIDLSSVVLPGSLKEIILSRMGRLDDDSKTVLRYGAAIGEVFSGSIVENAIAAHSNMSSIKIRTILSSLASSKLIRKEEGNFKFEYPELLELLYGEMENKEKMHLAIAETLEDMDADVYSTARQYSLSGDMAKTWVYQEKAGDQARRAMAPMDALKYFSLALLSFKKAKRMKKGGASDADSVRLLLKHGEVAHSMGEVDSALKSFKEALKLASKTKDDVLIATTHRNIGDVHRTRSSWDNAQKEFEISLKLVKTKGDKHGMAESLRGLGYVDWRRGDFGNAISRYSDALKYAEETKDIPLVGVILIEFGNVYNEKGDLDKALRYYLKSVDILTKTKEFSELSRVYNNIGDTYLQMGQWKNAVAFFKKTGAVAEKTGNKTMMGWALFNAATALSKGGDPDKALKYAQGSLKILERIGDNIGLSGVYKAFGLAYSSKQDWDKAEENFRKSLKIAEEANSPYNLAEVYLEAGCFHQEKGETNKACEFLEKSITISKDIGAKALVEKAEEHRKKVS